MAKKKHKEVIKRVPKFTILKRWKTSRKTYEKGDTLECENIKVIEFLKQNNII